MNNDMTLDKTWEFKGIEIQPLGYQRRADALSLCKRESFGPSDAAAFLFCCICEKKTLIRGKRNLEWFDEQVADWMEKVEYSQDDYETAATLVTEILNYSHSHKAEPVEDPSMLPDPLGN